MKFLILVSAVLLAASASPTGFSKDTAAAAANVTRAAERNIGFASFGSGTIGGAGGALWTVWDAWALRDALNSNAVRTVYVRGRIDLGVLFTASPGVILDVGSYTTITGGDADAEITGGGLRISQNQQVIIQNLKFSNAISYASGEQPNGNGGITNQVAGEFAEVDAILCEQAEYVWIDHNEFSDDPWIASMVPDSMMRHDGFVEINNGSNYITVSHNLFRNHNRVMLIGNDTTATQDVGKLKTSIVANWFMGTTQRNPMVRFGEVHVVNNLYTDIGNYSIGVGAGASIYAERNVFRNSRAWWHSDSVPSPTGNLQNVVNLFLNSNFKTVPCDVRWNPDSYFTFEPTSIPDVEAHVRRVAGVQ